MSVYARLVKPALFQMSPDLAHTLTVRCGKVAAHVPPVRSLLRAWAHDDPSLETVLCGLPLRNPVGLSAGFDKNIELTPLMEDLGFGFSTGGSVTLPPRAGNPRPWFYRLPRTRSLVVHAGMANKGLRAVEESIVASRSRVSGMPLVISVAVAKRTDGDTTESALEDAVDATRYIVRHELCQAVEINISCPNIGDEVSFSEPQIVEELFAALDTLERDVPFFVKMPSLVSTEELDALIDVLLKHDVQALTMANLVKDRGSVNLKDPLPDSVLGGLSGLPTRERGLEMVRHAYARLHGRLAIIGVGGIFTAEDAYARIRAGADAVSVITGAIFEGPGVVGRINKGLVELLRRDGFTSIAQAVGADHAAWPDRPALSARPVP